MHRYPSESSGFSGLLSRQIASASTDRTIGLGLLTPGMHILIEPFAMEPLSAASANCLRIERAANLAAFFRNEFSRSLRNLCPVTRC